MVGGPKLTTRRSRLASASVQLQARREAAVAREQKTQQQQAIEDARRRAEAEAIARRQTVQTLTRTARQLIYDGSYSQALGVLNQILAIDPTNDYAAKGTR